MNDTIEKTDAQRALPIVNLNGDSKETLSNNYREAHQAIHDAKKAMQACTPHGRNYQIGDCDYALARAEFEEWLTSLENIAKRLREYHRAVNGR